MKRPKSSIIITDDHSLFAEGLSRILKEEPDFSLLGICKDGQSLLHLLNSKRPDLIMLDIQMAGESGLTICAKIKVSHPKIKIVLISMFEEAQVITEGKKAGADGYIPKTTDAALLKETIRRVLSGETVFIKPQQPAKELSVQTPNPFLISTREREIIQLIKKGDTSKVIGKKLNISQYTVETHRKNILKKLQLNSIKELISYAYENGL